MMDDMHRHARRMEPDSRFQPLFDTFGRETGHAIIEFGVETYHMAVGFAYETMDCVKRLLEGEHVER